MPWVVLVFVSSCSGLRVFVFRLRVFVNKLRTSGSGPKAKEDHKGTILSRVEPDNLRIEALMSAARAIWAESTRLIDNMLCVPPE